MKCQCGHRKISHRYLALIGDNSGECLALNCECEQFKKEGTGD